MPKSPRVSFASIFLATSIAAFWDPTCFDFRRPLWLMKTYHTPDPGGFSRTLTPMRTAFAAERLKRLKGPIVDLAVLGQGPCKTTHAIGGSKFRLGSHNDADGHYILFRILRDQAWPGDGFSRDGHWPSLLGLMV